MDRSMPKQRPRSPWSWTPAARSITPAAGPDFPPLPQRCHAGRIQWNPQGAARAQMHAVKSHPKMRPGPSGWAGQVRERP